MHLNEKNDMKYLYSYIRKVHIVCYQYFRYLVVGVNIFFVKVIHEEKKTGQQCCNTRNYILGK